jgi:hypothetical protein
MTAEVRGRGSHWKVWRPDEAALASPLPVYDQDGILVEVLMVGAPPDGERKMIECQGGPFPSSEEAVEYARYLGYDDVKVVQTKTKTEALALARRARAKGGGDETDD